MGMFNGVGGFYRFTAAEIAGPQFKARAISYVLAGGVLAAFLGPNLARFTRDLIPEAEFAGSFASLLVVYALSLALITMASLPKPTHEERASGDRDLSTVMMQPVFMVAVFGALVGYGVMNLIMTATPLAMEGCGFAFGQTATVIQWHVVGMFAPSFFTGRLIERFGVLRVMFTGGILLLACILVSLNGMTYLHFLSSLVLLGLGWNFLFIGGSTLLTEAYASSEKAKTQGINDLIISTTVTMTSLSSGYLNFAFGWEHLNQVAIPAVILVLMAITWLIIRRRSVY